MCLLAEIPLAGVLLREVLLVAEEKVSAVSELLEKREKIPLGLEILGEEKALLFFDASLVIWYCWHLFFSVDWTGGHRQLYFWSLPMYRCADTTMKICEYKCNRCSNGIGMGKRI
jgi:hypothetical protein